MTNTRGNNNNQSAQQPVFALSPAQAVQGVIDYSSKLGGKLYDQAVAKLSEEPYDAKADGMRQFLSSFKDRARSAAWTSTLTVTQDGQQYFLPDHYGTLTVDSIRAHATNYIGTPTRNAQNSDQIYQCLKNSLTPTAKNSVQTKIKTYTVNGVPDGLLYFKAITQTVQVDTRATAATIKNKLMSLDSLMLECNQDVQSFNEQVVALKEKLEARGEEVTDLLHNLWKGYAACTDKEFSAYVSRRKSEWKHGEDISPEELMAETNNEYQSLVDDGVWLEPTEAEKQVIALTAQVEAQQKQLMQVQKAGNSASGKKTTKSNKGKSANSKGNKKSGKSGQPNYPEWKKKAPTGNDPHTKVVEGKTYYWCTHHTLWTAHKPSECKLANNASGGNSSSNNSPSTSGDKSKGSVAVSRSLMAIMEEEE